MMIIREAKEGDTQLTEKEFRDKIVIFQGRMESAPGALMGKELDAHCTLKHSFGDGIYVREMFAPKGTLVVTKMHKITHPYFVLKGDVSVMTEEGVMRVRAPYHGMTKAGTKRICYIHEDTIWVTVHVTKEKDLEKIEDEIIAKNYEEFDEFIDGDVIYSGG